jgi:hypothetical protein
MSDFETVQTFYNGTVTLTYRDDVHSYTITENGEDYVVPSATGVISVIDKPALVPWAAKMVVEYISLKTVVVNYGHEHSVIQIDDRLIKTKEDWEAFLQDAKKNFRNISETALDIGSLAHDWLEAYTQAMIEGVEYNAPLPANDKACFAITSALDWHRAHNFRPLAAEQRVYSKSLNTAGTFDWVALIDSCDDPKCCKVQFKDKLALGDYKSSKAIYDEYKLQTAFYKYAIDEEKDFVAGNGDIHIEVRVILRLGKEDGDFESSILLDEGEYEADINAFIGALSIFVWKEQNKLDAKAEKAKAKALKPKKVVVKRIKVPKVDAIEVVST